MCLIFVNLFSLSEINYFIFYKQFEEREELLNVFFLCSSCGLKLFFKNFLLCFF